VLVTGDKGHSISLIKDEPSLQVWTPDGITKALTSAEGLTAAKAYELIDAQRELVLATLGQLRQQIAENNRFQQYQKHSVCSIRMALSYGWPSIAWRTGTPSGC